MKNAIITGSQVYGQPTDESDVDVVVLMDRVDLDLLDALLPGGRQHCTGVTWRLGQLNLIATWSTEEFEAWNAARDECEARGGDLTRDESVKIHRQAFQKRNVPDEQRRSGRRPRVWKSIQELAADLTSRESQATID